VSLDHPQGLQLLTVLLPHPDGLNSRSQQRQTPRQNNHQQQQHLLLLQQLAYSAPQSEGWIHWPAMDSAALLLGSCC
jgi:hypothetical protein